MSEELKRFKKEELDSLIDKGLMCKEMRETLGYSNGSWHRITKEVLGETLSSYAEKRRGPFKYSYNKKYNVSKEDIDTLIDKGLNVGEIAKEIGCVPGHLPRIARRILGETLNTYIAKRKGIYFDWDKETHQLIDTLNDKGLNGKQMSEYMGFYPTAFCEKTKNFLGEYLSVYSAKRRGKYSKYNMS